MYYENPNMSAEAKVTHLELLLAQSNTLADAISLASLNSKAELIVVADRGRDILRDVAHEDGPTIVKGHFQSVPIVGQSVNQKLDEYIEKVDDYSIPQHEAELEMNLALIYTSFLHSKGQISLAQRGLGLVGRATKKIDRDNQFGMMHFAQRFGTIRYFFAAAVMSELFPGSEDFLAKNLESGVNAFQKARNIASGYAFYNQFMAVFNLGRIEFLRGEDRLLARRYFQTARFLTKYGEIKPFEKLTEHYQSALEDDAQFGTVIDDPPEYKASLMELVTVVLKPQEKREAGILLI